MSYNWIWPDFSDKAAPRKAIVQGVVACAFIASVDAGIGIYANVYHQTFQGYNAAVLVDGALFALIGWGLWKNSRIAAVSALVLMGIEIADKLLHHPKTFNFVTILLLLAIVNSVRGAFALHGQTQGEKLSSALSTPKPLG
ncbi:MAG: hypothetical protein ACLQMT_02010 [Candidatus Acidiferrales bacterium]